MPKAHSGHWAHRIHLASVVSVSLVSDHIDSEWPDRTQDLSLWGRSSDNAMAAHTWRHWHMGSHAGITDRKWSTLPTRATVVRPKQTDIFW